MRKFLAVLVASAAFAGSAAIDDQLVVFSTKGPDLYRDGTTVLDGECYALCWSKDGVFEGVAANGTAADPADRVVLVAPLAKDGRCPTVMFQIDATTAESLAGGTYAVYLLDTRVVSADGRVTVGRRNLVNAAGSVAAGVTATAGLSSAPAKAERTAAVVASVPAVAPAGVAQPQITGIRIADGYAYISVKSSDGRALPATLAVSGANALEKGFVGMMESAADRKGATEAILVRPTKGRTGFFKVQGL